MSSLQKKLIIPLSNTGRKYGYITWRKEYDEDVKAMFGMSGFVDLIFDDSCQKRKTVDWNKRRIGITWTLTRNLSKKVSKIVIEKQARNTWKVSFK